MTFTLRGNINSTSNINSHCVHKVHPILRDNEQFGAFKGEWTGRKDYQSQQEVKGH